MGNYKVNRAPSPRPFAFDNEAASHPLPAQLHSLSDTLLFTYLGFKDSTFAVTCLHCIKHLLGELDITWVMGRCLSLSC